jgi:hypothetical protein
MGYCEALFDQLSEEQKLLQATKKSVNRVSSQIQNQTPHKLEQDMAHVHPECFQCQWHSRTEAQNLA